MKLQGPDGRRKIPRQDPRPAKLPASPCPGRRGTVVERMLHVTRLRLTEPSTTTAGRGPAPRRGCRRKPDLRCGVHRDATAHGTPTEGAAASSAGQKARGQPSHYGETKDDQIPFSDACRDASPLTPRSRRMYLSDVRILSRERWRRGRRDDGDRGLIVHAQLRRRSWLQVHLCCDTAQTRARDA